MHLELNHSLHSRKTTNHLARIKYTNQTIGKGIQTLYTGVGVSTGCVTILMLQMVLDAFGPIFIATIFPCTKLPPGKATAPNQCWWFSGDGSSANLQRWLQWDASKHFYVLSHWAKLPAFKRGEICLQVTGDITDFCSLHELVSTHFCPKHASNWSISRVKMRLKTLKLYSKWCPPNLAVWFL